MVALYAMETRGENLANYIQNAASSTTIPRNDGGSCHFLVLIKGHEYDRGSYSVLIYTLNL